MPNPTTTPDEGMPPSETTDQPSLEATETVESLKVKLAAEQKAKLEAEHEAATWKNRVKEENPPKDKKKVDPDEEYTNWRIDNSARIALAKEQYEQELSELEEGGMKLTIAMREKALKLAESTVGIKKVETPEPLPTGSIDRGGQRLPVLTDYDRQFGIKAETKKKYAHIVEAA